jgi:hypothetical protein
MWEIVTFRSESMLRKRSESMLRKKGERGKQKTARTFLS